MQMVEGGAVAQVGARRGLGNSRALHLAVYFVALCLLAMLAAVFQPHLRWDMSAAEIAARAGFGDPGSFLMGARDIAREGWFTPGDYWLVHLWPPGFMLLEGALLRFLGESAPIFIPLLVLAALCGAAWMLLLREVLLPVVPARAATLAPFVPLTFPVVPFVLVSPLGLAFGETFSISFFLGAFLLVLLSRRTGSYWQAAAAGVLLALAAYFRSQFEMLVVFLTLGACVLLAVVAIAFLLKRRLVADRNTLLAVVVSLAVAHLAMAPWRYHNYVESGSARWVQTSSLIAINSLTPEQELVKAGAMFVVAGGGHLACKLEPSFCGKKEEEYLFRAFFLHPVAWLAEKAERLPTYWLAPPLPASVTTVKEGPTWPDVLANVLLLACLVAGLGRLWMIRRRPEFAVQAWFQLSFYGCLAGVYTLAHLEARYFYLPKVFAVVALLTLLPATASRRNSDNEVKR